MLFMVIETFKKGTLPTVGERFQQHGRMLPAGVMYVNSWMEATGSRCFQLMEAPSKESLQQWIDRWNDLVNFEIVSVLTSAEFWQKTQPT